MKYDYTALDAAILDRISNRAREFFYIHKSKVAKEADAIALHEGKGEFEGWLVTERRLQALRKKGAIVYINREWRINHE